MATGRLDDHNVIISAGYDCALRIWDGEHVVVLDVSSTAGAVVLARDGGICAATDTALCMWIVGNSCEQRC